MQQRFCKCTIIKHNEKGADMGSSLPGTYWPVSGGSRVLDRKRLSKGTRRNRGTLSGSWGWLSGGKYELGFSTKKCLINCVCNS